MKTIQELYAELGLTPNSATKTAAAKTASAEDHVIDFLKKLAGDSPDPAGSQQVPVNLGDAAANRPNGTSDNSQALSAFNSRENKPASVDSSTMNASSAPAMTQGTTSHKLNEVPLQGPAQAQTGDTEKLEVVAHKVAEILRRGQNQTPDVDLDQVYKVAFINDYLGRQAAQAMMVKAAQEGMPMADAAPAQVGGSDPTEEILAMLGQVSADQLVAKKDQLLAAIADVLESEGESEESEESEGEAKEAAAKLLQAIQKNPALKTKVASMLQGK